MATNREILDAIEEIANGQGIAGIRADIKSLNEKIANLSEDVTEIKSELAEVKEHVFVREDSLRSRIKALETSVDNIKKYEIDEIREILNSKKKRKYGIIDGVVGGGLLIIVGYILTKVFGIG